MEIDEYDEEQATDIPAAPFRHFGPQDPQGQAVQKVRSFSVYKNTVNLIEINIH